MHVARLEVRHAECFLRRFARGGKCRRIFLFEREIIGRVTEAEQARQLRFIDAVFLQIFFRKRARARRAPSVICEQSDTLNGGATLGFLSETCEAQS